MLRSVPTERKIKAVSKFLWTQRSNFGPAARVDHAMAFDSDRKRTVLFGGAAVDRNFSDTWEWDGSFWTQGEDIGPATRAGHAMAYDDARRGTLLFGGLDGGTYFGDTWQWDGASWTQLADTGPSPRTRHALVFDSSRKVAVLFGGVDSNGVHSDTWEFDGQEWTQKADSGPLARNLAAMCWDPAGSRVLLFGGVNQSADGGNQKYLGDTWAWNGTVWEQIAEFGPPARSSAAIASMGTAIALFGGSVITGSPARPQAFGDTWEFDGKRWAQQQDIGPLARNSPAMIFDAGRSRLVLFGGGILTGSVGTLGDTWEHAEAPAAAPQPPPPQPPPPPPPGDEVSVTAVQLTPNPIAVGQLLTIGVTLSGPAPAGGVQVEMSATQGQVPLVLPSISIAAGAQHGVGGLPIHGAGDLTFSARAGATAAVTAVVTVTA